MNVTVSVQKQGGLFFWSTEPDTPTWKFLVDLIQFYWKLDAAKTGRLIKLDEFCGVELKRPGNRCVIELFQQIPQQSPFIPILLQETDSENPQTLLQELQYLPVWDTESGPPALWRSAVRSVRRARPGWDFTLQQPFCNILPHLPSFS